MDTARKKVGAPRSRARGSRGGASAPVGPTPKGISAREALELLQAQGADVYDLLARAGRVRRETRGDVVALCSIVNAKSGHCGEDCAFCAQSSRAKAEIARYPLLPVEKMVGAARQAAADGATCFSIVTSGRAPGSKDLAAVGEALSIIGRELPLRPSASLGMLDGDALRRLRDAGLRRFHHNLETAESFFPAICSTRRWSDAVEAVRQAQQAGLSTCCGGIFGMGESLRQRVELLAAVRELDPDSVPLNFLNPIPGTRLEHLPTIPALEALQVIAVARLMMPDKEIRVCGGRERVLRDLQSWIFLAGADGMMVGGYLTTSGRPVADDLRMVVDAGMRLPGRGSSS
jgi:biotin synthase